MVLQFDFEKNLVELKRVYKDFLLPVFICDREFEIRWRNGAAEDLYPRFFDSDGMRRLLGEFDSVALLANLKRDGVRRVDGILALSGGHLNLTPIILDGEVGGVMIMIIGPQAVLSPPDIIESSKTPENIEINIRAGVAEMFSIMDKSAKKADWLGDSAVLRAFAGIERNCYRLLRIAANISGYTKFQSAPPNSAGKSIDVFDFIRKSRSAVSAFADEIGINVIFDLPGESEDSVAAIDASHLQMVYSNLLNNAFYFTKPGNEVKIIGRIGRERILLTVLDKGVGIPEDLLPDAIFKPYFSYGRDNRPAGIGLGLTLVKMIADGYGGTITIKSIENEWTAATFTLPRRAFSTGLSFRQDSAVTRPGGYDDRFSYASLSLQAAADSPYRQD